MLISTGEQAPSVNMVNCGLLQILGYFIQGLICVVYMPLCFQLARFTSEAASRVYADLGKDIDAGKVPDIAHAIVPPATKLFYNLPVSYCTLAPAPCCLLHWSHATYNLCNLACLTYLACIISTAQAFTGSCSRADQH